MTDHRTVKCEDLDEQVAPAAEGVQVHSGGIIRRQSVELDEQVAPTAEGVQVHSGGIIRPEAAR